MTGCEIIGFAATYMHGHWDAKKIIEALCEKPVQVIAKHLRNEIRQKSPILLSYHEVELQVSRKAFIYPL